MARGRRSDSTGQRRAAGNADNRSQHEDVITITSAVVPKDAEEHFGLHLIQVPNHHAADAVERDRLLRCPAGPEDCCVVRSVSDDGRMSSVVHSIGREQLTVRGEI